MSSRINSLLGERITTSDVTAANALSTASCKWLNGCASLSSTTSCGIVKGTSFLSLGLAHVNNFFQGTLGAVPSRGFKGLSGILKS